MNLRVTHTHLTVRVEVAYHKPLSGRCPVSFNGKQPIGNMLHTGTATCRYNGFFLLLLPRVLMLSRKRINKRVSLHEKNLIRSDRISKVTANTKRIVVRRFHYSAKH